MRLLGALLNALKTGLLLALECAWGLITLPLKLPAPPRGQSAIPGPPAAARPSVLTDEAAVRSDTVRAAEALVEATQGADVEATQRLHAAKILSWAAGTAVGDRPAFPSGLPMDLAAWAKNLSPRELGALARAGFTGAFAHLQGRDRVDGVPTVAALTASARPVSPIQTAVRVRRQPRSAHPAAAADSWRCPPPEPQYTPAAP